LSSLKKEDLEPIQDQVKRFVEQDIKPIVSLHEVVATPSQVESLLESALEMGVLDGGFEMGISIWENPKDPLSRLLSTQLLSLIAETNAGIAYQCHQYALTQWLRHTLGLTKESAETLDNTAISMQGHYGLARYSLANYLKGKTTQDDIVVLRDYFNASESTPCYVHGLNWDTLLAPTLDKNGVIQWQLLAADSLNRTEHKYSHGFDELSTWQWSRNTIKQSVISETSIIHEESKQLLTHLYAMNTLGLMSIAHGSVKHALNMAKDYCSIRVQGGKTVINHPAVQTLISQVSYFIHMANTQVQSACTKSAFEDLGILSLMRSNLHTEACQAANNALQCFGGIGYMQDNGIEKVVRDNNQLRLLNGTPTELKLFAAAWENCA